MWEEHAKHHGESSSSSSCLDDVQLSQSEPDEQVNGMINIFSPTSFVPICSPPSLLTTRLWLSTESEFRFIGGHRALAQQGHSEICVKIFEAEKKGIFQCEIENIPQLPDTFFGNPLETRAGVDDEAEKVIRM